VVGLPAEAYRTLEHLNNKYALDGRDPNSYTGILWCFGLFDRPWPPERRISAPCVTCRPTTRPASSPRAVPRLRRALPTIAETRARRSA